MPSRPPREISAHVASRPWIVGLVVLVCGHLVLVFSRSYATAGDWAFIELKTGDVFSRHSPLTGAWSRYGWNHPGPILYDLLAIPYLIAGSSWRGLWLGALALNVTALVVAVRLLEPAGRSAREGQPGVPGVPGIRADVSPVATWAMAIAAMWTLAAGTSHLLTDPWNASVVVIPVLTMVAATAAVLLGDRRGAAVTAVVFVAAAQTHAAYGVLLLPLAVTSLVVGLVRWRRFTLAWCSAAALSMLPALVDTTVNWPGNFVRSIRFTLTSAEPPVGFEQAVRVIGRATSLTFFSEPRLPSFAAIVSSSAWGVAPFAGLIALAVAHRLASRHGWSTQARSLEAVALLWFGGVLMVARTRGPLLIWLTTWMVAAAAITWCLVASVAIRWALERRSTRNLAGNPSDHAADADRTRDPGGADSAVGAGGADNVSNAGGAGGADSAGDPGTVDDDRAIAARPDAAPQGTATATTMLAVLTGLVSLGLATIHVVGSVGLGYPFQELAPVVQQFADDADGAGLLAGVPIVIDLAGDEYVAGAVQSGLIVLLEGRGFRPLARPDQRLQVGGHRTATSLEPPSLLVQVESRVGAPEGATVVSVWDPLTAPERAEADSLMVVLGVMLSAAGIGDRSPLLETELAPLAAFDSSSTVEAERAAFERLGELHARGPRIVLYLLER